MTDNQRVTIHGSERMSERHFKSSKMNKKTTQEAAIFGHMTKV